MNIYGNSTIPNVISISNPSVDDHVVTYDGVSGLQIQDSGVTIGSISGGPFLKLDGTTPMLANLNFGGFNVANCPNLIGSSKTTALNDIISQAANGVINNIPVYAGTSKILQNSSILSTDLVTAASNGVINNIPVYAGSSKALQNSSILSTDLVTSASSGTSGRVATYTGSGKNIQDGGTLLSALLTSSTAGSTYMPLAGGTFTGAVTHGLQTLTANYMLTDQISAQYWGYGNTVTDASALCIGRNNTASKWANIYGYLNNSSADYSQIIGIANTITGGPNGQGSICIGSNNAVGNASTWCSCIAIGNYLTNNVADSMVMGYNITNSTPSSFLFGSTASNLANIRPYNSGTCNLGAAANKFNDLHAIGSIISSGTTRSIDNLVTNAAGSAAIGNLPSFTSTGGKIIQDSSIVAANVVTNAGSATSGRVATFSANKIIQDGGTLLSDLLTSATAASTYAALAGATFIGTVAMGSNAITGTGANTAGSYSASLTTDSSSITSGSLQTLGGAGISKKLFIGTNCVIGPAQTITYEGRLNLLGTVSSTAGPHYTAYCSTDQYPVFQNLNYGHGTVALSMDGYWDGAWKSSDSGSNFNIYKITNQLQFNYNTGITAGSALTWLNAGYIDTSGILQWQKTIKTAAGVASSSTTTGSCIITGGTGISGALNVGGTTNITGNVAIGKTTGALSTLEAVGPIFSTNNAGASDKELSFDVQPAQTYAVISSYYQSIGVRDLSIQGQNISFFAAPIASGSGGGLGCLHLPNRGAVPSGATTNTGILYVESGALKYKGAAGSITTLAVT